MESPSIYKIGIPLEKVVAIGAHPDDIELGCGGTIALLIEDNVEIYYLILSLRGSNEEEVYSAAKSMNIPKSNVILPNLPNEGIERLSEQGGKIRSIFDQIRDEICPNLVIGPSPRDTHQDHKAAGEEMFRIFRPLSSSENLEPPICAVLSYELIRQNIFFSPNFYIQLDQRHIDKKIETQMEFKSQIGKRIYFKPEITINLARMRGIQVGVKYAEAYEASRFIVPL